jgi:hypothetical protein
MAFPLLAVLGAVLQDGQSRAAQQKAIRERGNATTQGIMRHHAQSMGGSPYPGMGADLRADFDKIEQQAEEGRNNQIGNILQAYFKSAKDAPPERMIGQDGDIPTVDNIGAGNRSGLSMVDSLFGGESTDLGETSFGRPALSEGSRGLGMVDSLFGDEEDPWGPGAF